MPLGQMQFSQCAALLEGSESGDSALSEHPDWVTQACQLVT